MSIKIFLAILVVAPLLIYFLRILVDEFKSDLQNLSMSLNLRRVRKREMVAIELEFPLIVELFAILIGAGLSPAQALAHISQKGSGQLISLLKPIVVKMRDGLNLAQALDLLSGQIDSTVIRRFCDSLAISTERGTPLIEVMNRHVEEVRQLLRINTSNRASKAEISLMIPVVFLILPISILFALWPSFFALSGGFSGIV